MLFRWWRKNRRSRLLKQPFPAQWEVWLPTHCRQFVNLAPTQQQLLRDRLRLLVAEKYWEGCGGLRVTEEMRFTIATHAALITLGFPELPFERLMSILIYPDTYLAKSHKRQPWGLEDDNAEPRLGEAWYRGPVILSWKDVERHCLEEPSGRNVVVHEFAHQLDMANSMVDGIPDLTGVSQPQKWVATFEAEFHHFLRRLAMGRNTVLDAYAGTNPAEFFAVGSEAFFEVPQALREHAPQLYELLRSCYRQDPAAASG